MREAGLRGCMRGRRKGTTRRSKRAPVEDLVKRNFAATEVDRVWVADITYIATAEGFLYLAFILDVHSRRIVGWAMENHLRTEIVVEALQMALWRRKPAPGLVHHSDQGVQYTALSFSQRLREVGITPSMGRTGSALDNAMAESFVSTLKAELVSKLKFPTRQSAKTAIFEYLETFYNTLAGCTHLLATGAPLTSRRIEWKKLGSRKVNVSALAGEFHTILTQRPL